MCLRLLWLKAFFLQGEHAGIVRCWLLDHYLKVGVKVVMTWDASPWGMGATVQLDGTFLEFFTIPVDAHDLEALGAQGSGSKC